MIKRYSVFQDPLQRPIPFFNQVTVIEGEGEDQHIAGTYWKLNDAYKEYGDFLKRNYKMNKDTNIIWFVCEYAKNQPVVCIEICAANCKVPKRFGRCKYYEENCEVDINDDDDNEFSDRQPKEKETI